MAALITIRTSLSKSALTSIDRLMEHEAHARVIKIRVHLTSWLLFDTEHGTSEVVTDGASEPEPISLDGTQFRGIIGLGGTICG